MRSIASLHPAMLQHMCPPACGLIHCRPRRVAAAAAVWLRRRCRQIEHHRRHCLDPGGALGSLLRVRLRLAARVANTALRDKTRVKPQSVKLRHPNIRCVQAISNAKGSVRTRRGGQRSPAAAPSSLRRLRPSAPVGGSTWLVVAAANLCMSRSKLRRWHCIKCFGVRLWGHSLGPLVLRSDFGVDFV